MTTAAEIAADKIALYGCSAGASLWAAIEQAIEAGMPARKARQAFDSLIQDLSSYVTAPEDDLFEASAFEAIPSKATSTAERSEMDNKAWAAHSAYIDAITDELAADVADYRYDQMRDERMMGGL